MSTIVDLFVHEQTLLWETSIQHRFMDSKAKDGALKQSTVELSVQSSWVRICFLLYFVH